MEVIQNRTFDEERAFIIRVKGVETLIMDDPKAKGEVVIA